MNKATLAADRLATTLKAEIPGLTTYVAFSIVHYATMLKVYYTCPCGETSSLDIAFYEEDDPRGKAFSADDIKDLLRRHVREEGNEPNF